MGRERRRRGREAGGGVGERQGERERERERGREQEHWDREQETDPRRSPRKGSCFWGKGPATQLQESLCLATAPRVREACSGSSAQRGVSHQRHCILVTLDSMLGVTIQIWVSPL